MEPRFQILHNAGSWPIKEDLILANVDLGDALDAALSDLQVASDVRHILRGGQRSEEVDIEFEAGNVRVPVDPHITIVTKAYFMERHDVGFGSGYRVQVAVGGVQRQESGILEAKYCFATLYYNDKRELITIDFHREMR